MPGGARIQLRNPPANRRAGFGRVRPASTQSKSSISASAGAAGTREKLCEGGDFHFTVFQARFVHYLFQPTRCRIRNPLFAALGANRCLHPPHDHDSAP